METYYSSDVMSEAEIKGNIYTLTQELTLDKLNYKASDSPYGKVDFKSVEIGLEEGQTTKKFWKRKFQNKIPQFNFPTLVVASRLS
jgi:hypothetical protein